MDIPVVIKNKLQTLDSSVEPVVSFFLERIEEAGLSSKPVLTYKEAMAYLGCSRRALKSLVDDGKIGASRPVDKGSGKVYFKRSDLEAYMLSAYKPSQAEIEAKAAGYVAAHR